MEGASHKLKGMTLNCPRLWPFVGVEKGCCLLDLLRHLDLVLLRLHIQDLEPLGAHQSVERGVDSWPYVRVLDGKIIEDPVVHVASEELVLCF